MSTREAHQHSTRRRARVLAWWATNSRPARILARIGLIASGIVHVLIGVIAVNVTRGINQRADQSGALDAVADVPGGTVALWVAVVALLGLAAWQWTGPIAPRKEGVTPNAWRDRMKSLGFVAVAFAALVFAVGGHTDAAETTHTISATLVRLPGGGIVLFLTGAAVASVGGAFVFRGVSRRFREDIDPPSGAVGTGIVVLGTIGHVAKGLALVLVGSLFIGGALSNDAHWTTGLDGAVRYLVALPTGVWPLAVIALGLASHGLYQVCRAAFLRR